MNPHLTPKAHSILCRLKGAFDDTVDDDSTLARFTPGGWWIGAERVDARACWRLLRLGAIREDAEPNGGVSYYYLNEEGQRLREDVSYIPIIIQAMRKRSAPVAVGPAP